MADNWGRTVAVIILSDATEIHINADAELDGKKFLAISKFVKTKNYVGPAKGGTLLIPNAKLAEFLKAIKTATIQNPRRST